MSHSATGRGSILVAESGAAVERRKCRSDVTRALDDSEAGFFAWKNTDGRTRGGCVKDNDTVRGLAQIEGYLLWNAEIDEARRQACRFTEQLPWLTSAQREDVERVYVTDRLAICRQAFNRIADRAVELRGEYTERYRQLRARCVAASFLAVGAVSGTCTAFTLLTR